ncbi:MAG TPA: DUF4296 domain-containing protein [Flavobacteriaceae bacterium]|jgi:hypothetical protein|nr:DUF4296 domain-containing protein [Flavobacteriaceae bacterium]
MKKSGSIFFLFIVLLSCTSRTIYKKPDRLINKEKMIEIWTDIYIARGAKHIKTKDLRKNINYIPFVFKKHQIDSLQFSESNLYYTSRIDDYEKIFLEVEKRLKEKKDIYNPKSELDSIIEKDKEIHSKDFE